MRRKTPKHPINEVSIQMFRDYQFNGKTQNEIAMEHGMSQSTVSSTLRWLELTYFSEAIRAEETGTMEELKTKYGITDQEHSMLLMNAQIIMRRLRI